MPSISARVSAMEDALTFLLNLDGTCCQDVAVVGYDSVLQNEDPEMNAESSKNCAETTGVPTRIATIPAETQGVKRRLVDRENDGLEDEVLPLKVVNPVSDDRCGEVAKIS
ncbi:hypothetical protein PLEOSDRAFT_1105213 [Pleurotus ostreatus PC15]|uniref:Uncharacterized protein n=1 Tax=Pleurotus ostreatus (strain PC15) TaxID=1137138 RepID=A0A067NE85_PLEO1|nr:hypothetical protein PLEOSDRAFT_1105213 [Pleurotus ostreatus PC15]